MKTIIIISAVILFLGTYVVVDASKKLIRGEEIATVGMQSDPISVYKVVDGLATCYVTRHGKFGAHAISCVK